MRSLQKLLFTAVVIVGLGTTHGFAKESQGNKEQTAQTETQVLDKKIAVIETEINVLESKGKQNLTKEDKIKRYHLKKQLLAAQKEKTAKLSEIAKNKREVNEALDRVLQKLDVIDKSISSNGANK